MNDNYGVPRDIFSRVKLAGIYVLDGLIVIGSTLLAFVLGSNIFPYTQFVQLIIFVILTAFISIYLVLPTNGNKRNYNSIMIYLRRRKKQFTSSQR
ncbi:DUF5592 family protein [Enterococcus sp. AZ102]|uniref:DUF5592 family protein n=1 Tax=unclassified Enterococcus TaxID=2608891 RepID=UPI003F25D507